MSSELAQLKDQGNLAFQEKKFNLAIEKYSLALNCPIVDPLKENEDRAAVYSNRSTTFLQIGKFKEALKDALECIKLRPDWGKGYYRKGQALESLERLKEAVIAFEIAKEKNPRSKEIQEKIVNLRVRMISEHFYNQQKEEDDEDEAFQENVQRIKNFSLKASQGSIAKGEQNPSSWADGLELNKKYDWLIDCYRMRCDDVSKYQGNLVGIYREELVDGKKYGILEDFLVFCKLAVLNKVIPSKWNWKTLLEIAVDSIQSAFDKDDAHDKWGGENVFSAMMGGRSLRYTAEIVYGTGVMEKSAGSSEFHNLMRKVSEKWRSIKRNPDFFADVGGIDAWKRFERKVHIEDY
jgi:tetratricopeptide (TPR) repeat protein